MGCFFSKPKTVSSVSTPEKPQSLQSTSILRMTLTPPSRSGTAANAREQPKGAALLQHPHDDDRDYAPSSECGYSSRNIQIARKCVWGANIRLVDSTTITSGSATTAWEGSLRIRHPEGSPSTNDCYPPEYLQGFLSLGRGWVRARVRWARGE